MAFRKIELGVLLRIEPADARTRILDALAAHGGDVKKAAKSLGVGRRTLHRFVTALRVRRALAKMRRDASSSHESP